MKPQFLEQLTKRPTISVMLIAVLFLSLFLTLKVSQQQQDERSKASGGGPFTIGTTTIGDILDTGDGNGITCNKYTASSDGTVSSVSVYVGAIDPTSKNYSVAVYSDSGNNPTSRLNAANGVLTANSWNSLLLSAPVTQGSNYWLCYNSSTTNTAYNNLRYTGGSTEALYKNIPYSSWSSTFGTVDARWTSSYSIYASANGVPVPTSTPIPTPTTAPTATSVPTATTVPPTPTRTPTPVPSATVVPTAVATATTAPTATSVPTMTPTSIPGITQLGLTLKMHGFGNAGDSANPTGAGSFNPLHPTRPVTIEVFNQANQLVLTKQGNVIFSSPSGSFKGTVDLGTTLANGIYTVKVKGNQFLKALVPGIQTLSGASTNLPSTVLIAGDINNDNVINILDYSVLIGCFSDFLPAVSCTPDQKLAADLTDDGNVNQFDYNLFLRELTNVGGQ